MREFRKVSNKYCSSIENRLDGGESDLREVDKKRVLVVNSRANKGMIYCSHGGCGNRFADSSKAPELVLTLRGCMMHIHYMPRTRLYLYSLL